MNSVFWMIAAGMTLLALAFIALPLIRNRKALVKTFAPIGFLLPALAFGLYLKWGSPDVLATHPGSLVARQSSQVSAGPAVEKKVGSVSSMLEALAARLESEPNNGEGWLLLAKSYKHLDQVDDAIAAYAKAVALGQFDAGLAGLSRSAGSTPATSSAQISGRVSLSDAAQSMVQPTDTLFVFARAVKGPPMPVAVLQRPAADLPLVFALNDSQSMNGSARLSDFDEVVVTARITRSGDATETLFGLEGKSGIVNVQGNEDIHLTISPRN